MHLTDTLQNSEVLLRLAMHASGMGAWQWDAASDHWFMDERACALFGLRSDQFTGTTTELLSVISPEDLPAVNAFLLCPARSGTPETLEFLVVWPDKSLHRLRAIGQLFGEEEGKADRAAGVICELPLHTPDEELLQKKLRDMQALFENIHGGIIIVDAESRTIQDANPYALRMLGAEKAAVVGNICHEHICPAEKGRCPVLDLNQQVDRSDRTLLDAAGNPLPILKTVVPIEIDGRACLVEYFLDMSAQKKMERELLESQQRLAIATTSAQIGIWDWTLSDNKLIWNAQMFRLYGLTEDLSVCDVQTWLKRVHSEDRTRVWCACEAALQHGQPYDLEFRIQRADGGIRYTKATGIVMRDSEGHPTRMLGVNFDITKIRNAEAARQESEDKFAKAFSCAPVMMSFISLEDGTILAINEMALFTLGFHSEEVVGRGVVEINALVPQSYDLLLRTLHEEGKITNLELEFHGKNGQIIYGLASGEVVELTGKQYLLLIAVDITARRQLEDKLHQSEKLAAIGQLAGGIAHDFNNQLVGILGYAELLLQHLKDADLQKYATNIRVAATHASDLTKQLLAFSRKGKYLSVPVNMHSIIDEVIELLSHSINKKIEIHREYLAATSTVLGDPTQLQNALLNLAVNARDAMPDGGMLTFTTSVSELQLSANEQDLPSGYYLQIRISDTGTGMDEATLKHIFEPFFTTKGVGKGTGLGLSAVDGAIKSHKGIIQVESHVGKGTTFAVSLPLTAEQEAAVAIPSPALLPRKEAHVFIVDDDIIVRELTTEILSDCGYKITTRKNGEEAIAYYHQAWQDIDLVILDLIMPRVGGKDAFLAMRNINPGMKALIFSGHSIDGEAQEIINAGALGFVQKPCEPTELIEKVGKAILA